MTYIPYKEEFFLRIPVKKDPSNNQKDFFAKKKILPDK